MPRKLTKPDDIEPLLSDPQNLPEIARLRAERQLVRSKQCPRRDAEILAAGFAFEAGCPIGAAAVIGFQTAAVRANRRAVGIGPADLAEGCFGFRVRRAEDLSKAQGLGRFRQEEVLSHNCRIRYRDSEYDNLGGLVNAKVSEYANIYSDTAIAEGAWLTRKRSGNGRKGPPNI